MATAAELDTATVFVGLGGNLGDPVRQLRTALAELAALERTELTGVSHLYRSAPMGPAGQPDYINAVARLHTRLTPEALLDALQAIEARAGRDRSGARWGPRTLDLDILLYGDRRIGSARLQVPHPGIAARNFVLYPLAELAPDLDIPGLGPLPALLTRCPPEGLERLVGGSK